MYTLCDGFSQNVAQTGVNFTCDSIAQQADPFENHTPPVETYGKYSTGGVWISNGVAQFQA